MKQTAATTALLDQAEAAGTDALRALSAIAEMPGGSMSEAPPGLATQAILHRLAVGLLAGSIVPCAHISLTAPAPAFWAPWAPGRIRCAPCLIRAHERIQGTREDGRCDKCRRHTVRINAIATQLPGCVVERTDGSAYALPPVQLHYGLCGTCHAADQTPAGQVPAA